MLEYFKCLLRRKFAVDEEVGYFEEVGVFGELFDGVASVPEDCEERSARFGWLECELTGIDGSR